MRLRQQKYLNNIVEQDHRFIKRRIRSMLVYKVFNIKISIVQKGQLLDRQTEHLCSFVLLGLKSNCNYILCI